MKQLLLTLLVPIAIGMFACVFAQTPAGKSQVQEKISDEVLELATSPQRIMLDVSGDGLTIDRAMVTAVLTGKNTLFRWTRKNTDDAFLTIDKFHFNYWGFDSIDIYDDNGNDLKKASAPYIFFQKGLTVTFNGKPEKPTTSGWDMLKIFDRNGDNRIDQKDRIFRLLALIADKNGDGVLGGSTAPPYDSYMSFYTSGVIPFESISLSHISANTYDEAGNLRADGSFYYKSGKKGLISNIYFKELDSAITKSPRDDISDEKFVIISLPTMKGVLGRLNTDFPADVEWSIDIKTPENKFITNRSGFSKHGAYYTLAPGNYNFRLNTITVENVPVEKGKETRLKTGVLNIVSEGGWHLYNESKEKYLTSYNKPRKFPLPVGSYQLKLGGQYYPVTIKDGETVEY